MPWIVVNESRCKGCGLCVNFCPKKTLGIAEYLNPKGYYPATQTDKPACVGCAICARVCPDVAISVYKEDAQPTAKT